MLPLTKTVAFKYWNTETMHAYMCTFKFNPLITTGNQFNLPHTPIRLILQHLLLSNQSQWLKICALCCAVRERTNLIRPNASSWIPIEKHATQLNPKSYLPRSYNSVAVYGLPVDACHRVLHNTLAKFKVITRRQNEFMMTTVDVGRRIHTLSFLQKRYWQKRNIYAILGVRFGAILFSSVALDIGLKHDFDTTNLDNISRFRIISVHKNE